MKSRLLVIALVAGMISLTSCEKEAYMGPVDAAGQPLQVRGGEDGGANTGGGSGEGITDSGHDSDYDTSKNKRKSSASGN